MVLWKEKSSGILHVSVIEVLLLILVHIIARVV